MPLNELFTIKSIDTTCYVVYNTTITQRNTLCTIQKGVKVSNDKLKQYRLNCGLTQVEVAKRANITEISYQRIEYGKQTPSLKTAILIAKTLNADVIELFGDNDTSEN